MKYVHTFLSVTEKKRHMNIFHPKKSARTPQGHPKQFFCKYKIEADKECGLSFILDAGYRMHAKKRAGNCRRKCRKETTGATKKPCTQSILEKYWKQRETVREAAADEKEEEEQEEQEEEQQEDTEDSGGESGDDKCMRGKRMMRLGGM